MAGEEAVSRGLPVVTCPVGGVAELFTDGREGYFVAPQDGHALAGALDSLLARPFRRAEMGAAGRELDLIDEVTALNRHV